MSSGQTVFAGGQKGDDNRRQLANSKSKRHGDNPAAKKLLARRGVPSTTREGGIGFVFFLGIFWGGLFIPDRLLIPVGVQSVWQTGRVERASAYFLLVLLFLLFRNL